MQRVSPDAGQKNTVSVQTLELDCLELRTYDEGVQISVYVCMFQSMNTFRRSGAPTSLFFCHVQTKLLYSHSFLLVLKHLNLKLLTHLYTVIRTSQQKVCTWIASSSELMK